MKQIQSRLKSVEDILGTRERRKIFFFRLDPDIPEENEIAFMKNSPDLDNCDIYIFTFGKENLGRNSHVDPEFIKRVTGRL